MTGQSTDFGTGHKGLQLPLSRCVALDMFFLENFFIYKMGITVPNSKFLSV